jgi:hypothetical protein
LHAGDGNAQEPLFGFRREAEAKDKIVPRVEGAQRFQGALAR